MSMLLSFLVPANASLQADLICMPEVVDCDQSKQPSEVTLSLEVDHGILDDDVP